MNLRRGLFRLWIVGSALWVLAVAFVSYGSIKRVRTEHVRSTASRRAHIRCPSARYANSDSYGQDAAERLCARQTLALGCSSALGNPWDLGRDRTRHSVSGASSWIVAGVKFEWVR